MMKIMFAKNLKSLRKEKNITQMELAEEFNVGRGTLAKWETEKTEPDLGTVAALADYFHVTLDELILGKLDSKSNAETKSVQEQLDELREIILLKKKEVTEDNFYDNFVSYRCELLKDDIDPDICFDLGCEEFEKGNYDNALMCFEEAVARGDVDAINTILDVYKEIFDVLATDEEDYWKYRLQMSKKLQEYGKIIELDIEERLKSNFKLK